ncbi:hypothetical protein RSSM_03572 [Rhodopirellula sallentina SM41]|uniref:Uncharacterized protein n=1 Tax=Rhodopirellula sallentina SM41 TaxID=1263870 RepID=M5UG71_9BACT|nr:hypothetical protein RSSM_03572 [Rhodopirellula sallentina SM41]
MTEFYGGVSAECWSKNHQSIGVSRDWHGQRFGRALIGTGKWGCRPTAD